MKIGIDISFSHKDISAILGTILYLQRSGIDCYCISATGSAGLAIYLYTLGISAEEIINLYEKIEKYVKGNRVLKWFSKRKIEKNINAIISKSERKNKKILSSIYYYNASTEKVEIYTAQKLLHTYQINEKILVRKFIDIILFGKTPNSKNLPYQITSIPCPWIVTMLGCDKSLCFTHENIERKSGNGYNIIINVPYTKQENSFYERCESVYKLILSKEKDIFEKLFFK